jgi:RHS repeat-associated protein
MGTPEAMYDEDGKRSWSCELNSYGRVRSYEGQSKTDCPFRYQGQYEDAETGLYYNRFRYYSPDEGIYISQDPIKLNGGLNLYSYVQDVNKWIDPCGLDWNYVLTDINGDVYYHGKASDNDTLEGVMDRHRNTTNSSGSETRFGKGDTITRTTDIGTDPEIVRGIEQRGIEQSGGPTGRGSDKPRTNKINSIDPNRTASNPKATDHKYDTRTAAADGYLNEHGVTRSEDLRHQRDASQSLCGV